MLTLNHTLITVDHSIYIDDLEPAFLLQQVRPLYYATLFSPEVCHHDNV